MSMYKHVLHTARPSLSLIGLCKTVAPFPQFDCQVRFALAALDGSMVLPNRDEMEADIERDYQWRLSQGMPPRHAHHMGDLQWGYNNMLAELGGFEPIATVVNRLYDHIHGIRRRRLADYKKINFHFTGTDSFRESEVDT